MKTEHTKQNPTIPDIQINQTVTQNISKTMVELSKKETPSVDKKENSTDTKLNLEGTNNTTTQFAQLQTIINRLELNQRISLEALNRTSSENSSEFKSRKRRRRKNREDIKSVVQMMKEILDYEEESASNDRKNEIKRTTSKEISRYDDQGKVAGEKKSISKQSRSTKRNNKISKRRQNMQSSNTGHKKRHQQSKHERALNS